ncbi:MAG: Imidazolonepropionase [Acetothermia bacterium 64_32]|nr:MAG: Imidazolonepropionase [Acetothermia bacterium 64_32]HAF70591.1 imidazolonepropionase [Candidatus Acetothermia bacterium]
MDLLIQGIGQLVTPLGKGPLSGSDQGRLQVLDDAYIVVREGRIAEVGQGSPPRLPCPTMDAQGRLVTPGLVDPHTHAVFAGTRVAEFLARTRGDRYTGGGILTTVAAVRAASEDELVELARPRLLRMLQEGTTTVEIKSGYGLTTEDELKMLRAIRRLSEALPLTVVPTFLGAHAFPGELPREEYIELVVEEMLPQVAKEGLARFCDVFCDRGFFTVEEARLVLTRGREHGLSPKLHADELADVGAAGLAAELKAVSADHLLHVSDRGMEKLAEAGVVGVLLPGTAFVLSEPYPPARRLIQAGVPVALGTDFNPGSCPISSLPLVMSLAVLRLGLSPEEALCAATLNAAAVVGLAEEVGSLEPGKLADLVIWDAHELGELPYFIGHRLALVVVKAGEVAWRTSGFSPTPS